MFSIPAATNLRIAALETRSHSAVSMGGSNELVECFCGGVVA